MTRSRLHTRLKDLKTNVSVQDYFSKEGVSQSFLKHMREGINRDKDDIEIYIEDKRHFLLGNAVDEFITDSVGLSRYVVVDSVPSSQYIRIVEELLKYDDIDMIDHIKEACLKNNFGSTVWKKETFYKKILDDKPQVRQYLDMRRTLKEGQVIISSTEYEQINRCISQFYEREEFKELLKNEQRYSIYYQVPIFFTYLNVKCKALLDMLVVDNETNTIHISDLKTTTTFDKFIDSFTNFKYYIQAEFYTLAIMMWLEQESLHQQYRVHNQFDFIVVQKKGGEAFTGRYTIHDGHKINDLLDMYKKRKEKDSWSVHYELVDGQFFNLNNLDI